MDERLGPNPPFVNDMMAFNQCLLDCTLDELHSFGCEHTSTNKREAIARVWSRLDRVLSNPSWLLEYPNTQVQVLPSGISDHSPLLVTVQDNYRPRKQFSYLNCWAAHKEYEEMVMQAWGLPVRGSVMFKFFGKLKHVRKTLIKLHNTSYSGISKRVQEAKIALEDCQNQLQLRPLDPILFEQEQKLLNRYLIFKKTEKSSLAQRAKIQDVKYNDAPTNYYFSKIASRKHQVTIGRIMDRQGIEKIGSQDVNQAFVDYYNCLLGQNVAVNCESMTELQGNKVLTSDWEGLCREITQTEIKSVVFSIDSNKSPGHDGFSAHFFKKSWETIKEDFCKAIQSFFRTGKMSKQANTTLLALIPKKPVVATVMDYRPIASC
ncbi:uncharacterized protein LOC141617228 [Silene latifolia]|uniref:uncharacterized protein LOC141617228 n=1 Tax=Silene latifolia TaxID=37657 RepID=UPI003D77DAA2